MIWYESRLTAESRRPAAQDIPGIFASIGLAGPFWDLLGGTEKPPVS